MAVLNCFSSVIVLNCFHLSINYDIWIAIAILISSSFQTAFQKCIISCFPEFGVCWWEI